MYRAEVTRKIEMKRGGLKYINRTASYFLPMPRMTVLYTARRDSCTGHWLPAMDAVY